MFGWNVVFTILYKHDATVFEIDQSCVSFAQHSRIFLVGSSSLFHNQNDSAKLNSVFEIPLFAVPTKVALLFIGKAFCCLPSHPKLVYSMWLASLCFVVSLASFLAWISLSVAVLIPRRFFICKHWSVKWSSLRKFKLSTACSLSAHANKDSKLFSESSIAVPPLKLL